MISEADKNEMCRMRGLGFTLDYIAKATGYSASSVANATACVERPLASSGKDKQIEAMIHKLVRYRSPGAGVQREKRPCEHCQWRMNKGRPCCLRNLLSGGTEMTFKEYKNCGHCPLT